MNRNHFFMIGLVVLFLGIQVHVVDSYVLNEKTTKFVAKRFKKEDPANSVTSDFLLASAGQQPIVKKTVEPPRWLGWLGMSLGAVLILHSFSMQKPD